MFHLFLQAYNTIKEIIFKNKVSRTLRLYFISKRKQLESHQQREGLTWTKKETFLLAVAYFCECKKDLDIFDEKISPLKFQHVFN